MARRDSERPEVPWQGPENGPGSGVVFVLLVILFVAAAVGIFVATGLILGGN